LTCPAAQSPVLSWQTVSPAIREVPPTAGTERLTVWVASLSCEVRNRKSQVCPVAPAVSVVCSAVKLSIGSSGVTAINVADTSPAPTAQATEYAVARARPLKVTLCVPPSAIAPGAATARIAPPAAVELLMPASCDALAARASAHWTAPAPRLPTPPEGFVTPTTRACAVDADAVSSTVPAPDPPASDVAACRISLTLSAVAQPTW
jgi:hypothetical protein